MYMYICTNLAFTISMFPISIFPGPGVVGPASGRFLGLHGPRHGRGRRRRGGAALCGDGDDDGCEGAAGAAGGILGTRLETRNLAFLAFFFSDFFF